MVDAQLLYDKKDVPKSDYRMAKELAQKAKSDASKNLVLWVCANEIKNLL